MHTGPLQGRVLRPYRGRVRPQPAGVGESTLGPIVGAVTEPDHPALRRLLEDSDTRAALERLAGLAGSDLTTVLLELARRRVAGRKPADVLAQYRTDRLVEPAASDPLALGRRRMRALEIAAPVFDPVLTSPLAPLGAHHVLGGISQDRVVTTLRPGEVAADPTNSLALEAAVRRGRLLDADPKSAEPIRLVAADRVLRAQVFDEPLAYSHFALLGLVTAGRDVGNHDFETAALVGHLRVLVEIVRDTTAAPIVIRLSDLDGGFGGVVERVATSLAGLATVQEWPDRTAGTGYYPNVCFKLNVVTGADELDIADGGIVPWTQMLLQNRKERLMISGLGLERLAPPA